MVSVKRKLPEGQPEISRSNAKKIKGPPPSFASVSSNRFIALRFSSTKMKQKPTQHLHPSSCRWRTDWVQCLQGLLVLLFSIFRWRSGMFDSYSSRLLHLLLASNPWSNSQWLFLHLLLVKLPAYIDYFTLARWRFPGSRKTVHNSGPC